MPSPTSFPDPHKNPEAWANRANLLRRKGFEFDGAYDPVTNKSLISKEERLEILDETQIKVGKRYFSRFGRFFLESKENKKNSQSKTTETFNLKTFSFSSKERDDFGDFLSRAVEMLPLKPRSTTRPNPIIDKTNRSRFLQSYIDNPDSELRPTRVIACPEHFQETNYQKYLNYADIVLFKFYEADEKVKIGGQLAETKLELAIQYANMLSAEEDQSQISKLISFFNKTFNDANCDLQSLLNVNEEEHEFEVKLVTYLLLARKGFDPDMIFAYMLQSLSEDAPKYTQADVVERKTNWVSRNTDEFSGNLKDGLRSFLVRSLIRCAQVSLEAVINRKSTNREERFQELQDTLEKVQYLEDIALILLERRWDEN